MNRPGVFDLALYRGDSYAWSFTLWDDDLKSDPTDLTGCTVAAHVAPTTETPAVMSLTCAIVMPNIINVSVPAAAWASATLTKGVWDLQLTYASGEVFTVVAGKVDVVADVTKVAP